MDFQKMLEGLVGGGFDPTELIKPKKNGPPMGQLLPSQTAMQELGQGADDFIKFDASKYTPIAQHDTAAATGAESSRSFGQGGGGMSAAKGAGMGLLQGVQDAVKPNAWITPPPADSSIRDNAIQSVLAQPPPMQMGQYDPYGMQGFAYGGTFRPEDGIVQIGTEKAIVDEDGTVHVIPGTPEDQAKAAVAEELIDVNRQMEQPVAQGNPNDLLMNAPEEYGLNQTIQGGQPDYAQLMSASNGGYQPQNDPESLESLYGNLGKIQNEKGSPWRDAGFGALQGVANWLNKTNNPIQNYSDMQKARKSRPVLTKIGIIEGQKKREQDEAYNKARVDTIYADDARQREDMERKRTANDRSYEIRRDTLDWKKEDKEKYYELEDVKIKAKEKNDLRTYEIADRKQKELERHNKATEGQSANRTNTTFKLGQLRIAAQKELKIMQEAAKNGRQAEVLAARERLAKIKADKDALDGAPAPEFYGPVVTP